MSFPMNSTTAKAYISVALSGADPQAEHLCRLIHIYACEEWHTWATTPPHDVATFNGFALTRKASLINQAMAVISARTPAELEQQKPFYQDQYAGYITHFCDFMNMRNTHLLHLFSQALRENAALRQRLVATHSGPRFSHTAGWVKAPQNARPTGRVAASTEGTAQGADADAGEGGEVRGRFAGSWLRLPRGRRWYAR